MEVQIWKRRSAYVLTTFKDAWLLTAKQLIPLVLAWMASLAGPILILAFGLGLGTMVDKLNGLRHAGFGTLCGFVIPFFLIGGLWAGWIHISLKVARQIPVKTADIFRPLGQVLSAFWVLILTSSAMGILSFLVIVSPLLFLKWQLAPYYIVDRGFGPIKAMNKSWEDTKLVFIPLALLDLLFVGLQTLTAATFVGPFFVHIGLTVATALVYAKWLSDPDNPEIPQIETDETAH